MSEAFWQAKIRGLLYTFNFSALKAQTGPEAQPFLDACIERLPQPSDPSSRSTPNLSYLANLITDASDRAVLNAAQLDTQELEIVHLLSGEKLLQLLNLDTYRSLVRQPNNQTQSQTQEADPATPKQIDSQQLFWWLWRCLPQAVCQQNESLLLLPAATSLPDASVWSHSSLTAAMAGALTGYEQTSNQEQLASGQPNSHPYLTIFSFTPVQELIKASRKMRDFWAGSWLLHYLSAKICWQLALKYGPDSLIYPSLYQQPLIDHWLLQKWSDFQPWIEKPRDRALLTAGFPNVIVAILPKGEVKAAMQTAKQTLYSEWLKLGNLVFDELKERHWTGTLQRESRTWNGWLKAQWQPYWSALPLGTEGQGFTNEAVLEEDIATLQTWLDIHNKACNLKDEKSILLHKAELEFLRVVQKLQQDEQNLAGVNVGSWWPYVFDQLRFSLSAVKNARSWDIPTAFGPRSTISGFGPVVYPDLNEDKFKGKGHHPITEGETKRFWQNRAGLFDGSEQLNATETLKRAVHKVLPKELGLAENAIAASYPDLTAGVSGYLKVSNQQHLDYFRRVCDVVYGKLDQFPKVKQTIQEDTGQKWGIPWIDQHSGFNLGSYPSRLLNAGWLVADLEIPEDLKPDDRPQFQTDIDRYYPGNNPTDWYVLACGDGDGMSQWLQGTHLKNYKDYMPSALAQPETTDEKPDEVHKAFENLKQLKKRMGPSTHNALSRALLDFSNQLLPYLTEQRYAGRLIYGGGDDVLAYTNLWEWDSWLWDVHECFRGTDDPAEEFESKGDYWCWRCDEPNPPVAKRPLFTMGREATISFGIVIAHHSVPLAIALENLWAAEKNGAKEHYCPGLTHAKKDAVQIRVIYGSGNLLASTAKFAAFKQWRSLLLLVNTISELDSALFEQAAQVWEQHPAPISDAIEPWVKSFCERRDLFKGEDAAKKQKKHEFCQCLTDLLRELWQTAQHDDNPQKQAKQRDREIQNWLKLAAFTLRNRDITIKPERLP